VFEVELFASEVAGRLAGEWPFRWRDISRETLEDIIYDAMICLRTEMDEEAEDV